MFEPLAKSVVLAHFLSVVISSLPLLQSFINIHVINHEMKPFVVFLDVPTRR